MTDPSPLRSTSPTLLTSTQNAAIFSCCAVLVSTALASIGFLVFLVLFASLCISGGWRQLDLKSFPVGFAVALTTYFAWQFVGLSYTDAPLAYGLETIYSDRKLLFILPLTLVFSDENPKKRFLSIFFGLAVLGLAISFTLKLPWVQELLAHLPVKLTRSTAPLAPENVFRSYATQSMVFALSAFLAIWFASRQRGSVARAAFYILAVAFVVNIVTLTDGRSGYLVVLVLIVWSFAMRQGFKGVMIGAAAAVALALLAFFLSSSVHDRVMRGVSEIANFENIPEETSLGRRMVMYRTTVDMIRENPVFGVGTGGFKQRFSAIAAEKYTGWRAKPADDPHNQYLFILAENGLIGLLAFLATIGMVLKYCLRGGSIYGKMAAGCVLAWCATSIFSGHFRTFPEGHLIAFITGILMVNRPTGET